MVHLPRQIHITELYMWKYDAKSLIFFGLRSRNNFPMTFDAANHDYCSFNIHLFTHMKLVECTRFVSFLSPGNKG